MSEPIGSVARPLRVAIVGAGPSGFYTAAALLATKDLTVSVDLIDRLPTPYGLVRYGVAPDHPKIKEVVRVFEKLALDPRVRFLGHVEYGRDLSLADLRRHYDQVVFAVGGQSDRRLGIAGEDLAGSLSSTAFVAWYSRHPDFLDLAPDLAAFYEYNAFLTEPWDGPAAIAATDGVSLLAGMDRNGLRPARWTLTPDVLLVASEAGICPEEEARAVETGQLGPGEMIVFDGETGEVLKSEAVKSGLARMHPYSEWINTETLHIQAPFDELADDRFDAAALARVFGYTPEAAIVQVHGTGPFHIHWRAGQEWRDELKTLDSPDAAQVFRFRKGERVQTPRGSGRIRQGYDSGEYTGYEIDGEDGNLFMASQSEVSKLPR